MTPVWKGAHPGNFRRGRPGAWRPEAIVIHVMDGTLVGTDAWFNDPASGVSAHYGVGKDGIVHQYVKEEDTAFHAGTVVGPTWSRIRTDSLGRYVNPNYYTIGVEHAGWGARDERWPEAQLQASLKLVRGIAERWSIPVDAAHVIRHALIRSSKPHCPGRGLDFDDYLARLDTTVAVAAPVEERPFAATVRAVATLNVRPRPAAAGPAPRRLLAGDPFAAVAVAAGEPHRGNPNWYRNAEREYIWAGATDRPLPE